MEKTLKDFRASYRVVIKGIIKDDQGSILLVRERSETWDLPGGGLEHGEDPKIALERELEEELEVKIKMGDRLRAFGTWNTKFDAPVLILAYDCELVGEPSVTADVSEFRYFTQGELASLKLDSTLENGVLVKVLLS